MQDNTPLRHHLKTSRQPFVVISGVSIELFNAYFEDDEDAPVTLRFVDLVNGSIIITDFPSEAHENFIGNFEYAFLQASGNGTEVRKSRSFTASRGQGIKKKQADATFGPRRRTLNRGPPPTLDEEPPRVLRRCSEWVTLAVEVGHYQAWNGLLVAGNWWSNYVGVKYVLLMQADKKATKLEYQLHEISQVGDLPPASRRGTVKLGDVAGEASPANMHDFCNVNLLRVLEGAHDILSK
ncbi:hypothetical protein SDRG_07586 [Saprolegnia diclina VS20]|uniref:Uncharacterized protein n=1 Tax=Saprolegnia diclina (strain VS20) TaxID=1156394 RepID=T0RQC9_SAPDV|nr:hypothetical protein SDRG_07586 [Saprolegnia diclina VS20]EQC34778.1 hypothetical protein SDRG_07586 [Saprolegnia diclina VS20]|eukprot:XP_008611650.1 hypothetical protein SDRG_07586 [Saprolegnia diclina VS20]